MCSISVAPMPSRILMPVAACQASKVAFGRVSPAETHLRSDEMSCSRELAEHRAVGGRRGEADGGAVIARSAASRSSGPALLQQDRGGADAQREQHEAAEPEGEGERRRADEAVRRPRRAARGAVAVADRQHVAMEVHGALRLAGGAGGEGDQADVVARGVAGGEMLVAGLGHQRFERVGRAAAPVDDALELAGERPAPSPSRRPGGGRTARARSSPWRADRRAPWRAAAAWSRPRRRRP